jgi:hypothetical protein
MVQSTAAGALAPLAGSFLGAPFMMVGGFGAAKAAEQARQQAMDIANTPGLDTRAVGAQALGDIMANRPLWEDAVGQMNEVQRAQRLAGLGQFIPGYQQDIAQQQDILRNYMGGQIPLDVQQQIQNNAAARALGGGYGGTGMHGNLMARDLGLTSLQLQQAGMAGMQGLRGQLASFMPGDINVSSYAGLTPAQQIDLRSAERSERIRNLMAAAGMPTGQAVKAGMWSGIGQAFAQAGSQAGQAYAQNPNIFGGGIGSNASFSAATQPTTLPPPPSGATATLSPWGYP